MIVANGHRSFDEGEFWRMVPAYRRLESDRFLDASWQERNCVQSARDLGERFEGELDAAFLDDVARGLEASRMQLRVTPYVLARIDWNDPVRDPIRRQFVPLGSEIEPDHPFVRTDSLAEREHSPVPGLVRRYRDKVLFLPRTTCPVYCRFCTRSYVVGAETTAQKKLDLGPTRGRWRGVFEWIAEHPEIEDVVVSGGDAFHLAPDQITEIGTALLAMPHIHRIRFATKGLAVLPSRLREGDPWLDAITRLADAGRKRLCEVCIHTHVNHPREITWVTRDAMARLFERGVPVRNQAVLLRGVNDDAPTMEKLVKRLSAVQIAPYYVYVHDLIPGVEGLRTSVQAALELEKATRGATAGFRTPTFVVDLPGGGGKRSVGSYESYDKRTGVSAWTSPAVAPGRVFQHFDPLATLDEEGRAFWRATPARAVS